MSSPRSLALALTLAALTAIPAAAGEVWVVEGLARTATGPTTGVVWRAGAAFHNRGSAPAAIRLLHVSNGARQVPFTITIAPGASEHVSGTADAALWVSRYDVPADVVVDGRLELHAGDAQPPGHPPVLIPFAKLRMPTFTALVPAGQEQLHAGVDLGGQTVRLNVGIYNGGTVPAPATIAVYRPFCSAAPIVQTALVPADSVVQVTVPEVTPCTSPTAVHFSSMYLTVKVDAPSFSFVSTLANAAPSATASVD